MRSISNLQGSVWKEEAGPFRGNGGFALIASILALFILMGLGLLVFTVSTRDVRISSRVVGEKKAFCAAEAGIHALTNGFDPENLAGSAVTSVQVDPNNDPDSRYTTGTPSRPTTGPTTIPIAGYSIGGGQVWGQERFNARVTGMNTRYNSMVPVDVGLGFGPVEITTAYR
jgi:Tfp pilus assembly protein PilX